MEAREAFEVLYRRYTPTLFAATLHRTGNGDVALTEDAVQAVMIRLWERRAELPDIGDVRGYLIRAAARQCLDAQRTTTRANTRDAIAVTLLAEESTGAEEQHAAAEVIRRWRPYSRQTRTGVAIDWLAASLV